MNRTAFTTASLLAVLVGAGCQQDGLPYQDTASDGGSPPARPDLARRDLAPGVADLIDRLPPDQAFPADLAPPADLTPPPDLTPPADLAPPPGYPAPHAPLPLVVSEGGRVLANPEMTSVTFGGDKLAADLDAMLAGLGQSVWWSALSQYGVGAPSTRPPVHAIEVLPARLDDSEIQTWLDGKLDGKHPEYGVPGQGSLFVLYYPASTRITVQGATSCQQFAGYHNSFIGSLGQSVAYAVIARCGPLPGLTQLQTLTVDATHEVAEAATDPEPGDRPAFYPTDPASLGWMQVVGGGEVGDLCAYDSGWTVQPRDLPYTVQRIWSDEAVKAGHDPCAPADGGLVYFNASPVLPDMIAVQVDQGRRQAPGLKLARGVPRTIEVDLWSDGPAGPWTVGAVPGLLTDGTISFQWDSRSGKNGDKLHLTVTLTKPSSMKNDGFFIQSTLGQRSHRFAVAVQAQ
jgi:hypothetical protein